MAQFGKAISRSGALSQKKHVVWLQLMLICKRLNGPSENETVVIKFLFYRHWALTLVFMALSAVCFGLTSLNLFHLFEANLNYIITNGRMALTDGGLEQLLELIGYGFLSLASYLVLKACEKVLVERILK